MANNDKILQTIRHLLDKTEERGATEAEAQSCAAMAATLMAKHGIESRSLGVEKQPDTVVLEAKGSDQEARWKWQCVLASAVGKTCFCFVTRNDTLRRISFFGTPEETEVAKELYAFLAVQIVFLSAQSCIGKTKKYGEDFVLGCALRVAKRLVEKHQEEVYRYQNGTAIVRVAIETARDFAAEQRGEIRKVTFEGKVGNTKGLRDGAEAGNRIKLEEEAALVASSTSKRVAAGPRALA